MFPVIQKDLLNLKSIDLNFNVLECSFTLNVKNVIFNISIPKLIAIEEIPGNSLKFQILFPKSH